MQTKKVALLCVGSFVIIYFMLSYNKSEPDTGTTHVIDESKVTHVDNDITKTTTILVTDPNWYFTEYNWFKNTVTTPAYARSTNPGSYFKIAFQGSTSATLSIVPSSLTKPYMTLSWTVDDTHSQKTVLSTSDTKVLLASDLSSASTHIITLYIENSLQTEDRWTIPECSLTINGLIVDLGTTTLPVNLRPKRILAYWDSIGEGVQAVQRAGSDLINNDSKGTSLMALKNHLSAEVSVVAFGGQGYTVTGGGGVPPLVSLDGGVSGWNHFDSHNPRTRHNGKLHPNPDYIICGHGTNDALRPADPTKLRKSVFSWLIAMRAASPSSFIFVVIPYGGFAVEQITAGFKDYKQHQPSDIRVALIDLGPEAAAGLTANPRAPNEFAPDGLHPYTARNKVLGSMLADAIVKIEKDGS